MSFNKPWLTPISATLDAPLYWSPSRFHCLRGVPLLRMWQLDDLALPDYEVGNACSGQCCYRFVANCLWNCIHVRE